MKKVIILIASVIVISLGLTLGVIASNDKPNTTVIYENGNRVSEYTENDTSYIEGD